MLCVLDLTIDSSPTCADPSLCYATGEAIEASDSI